MDTSNTASIGSKIEKGEIEPKNQVSSCPWTRRTWRKIILGSIVATNLGSLVVTIYGVAINNHLLAYIGAGSGVFFSAAGLVTHVGTYEC